MAEAEDTHREAVDQLGQAMTAHVRKMSTFVTNPTNQRIAREFAVRSVPIIASVAVSRGGLLTPASANTARLAVVQRGLRMAPALNAFKNVRPMPVRAFAF